MHSSLERLDHSESAGRREIIVRMYRQGLGDCFLLALPTDDPKQPRYVLIDCGVHSRESQGTERLGQAMRNLARATGGCLHVVVATHEHADHLSGFVQKDSPFLTPDLEVKSVWLAWTEKRGDEDADPLRRKRGHAEAVIRRAVEQATAQPTPAAKNLAGVLDAFTEFEHPAPHAVNVTEVTAKIENWAAANSAARKFLAPGEVSRVLGASKTKGKPEPTSNELALGVLAAKAGDDHTHYCEPGRVQSIPDVSDLRAYVLGPPRPTGTKGDLLRRADPQKIRGRQENDPEGQYNEVYLSGGNDTRALALAPALLPDEETKEGVWVSDIHYPFAGQYRREYLSFEGEGDTAKVNWKKNQSDRTRVAESFLKDNYLDPAQHWRRIDGDWLQSAEQLALNLNGDTNNTSLVLAFEWGPPGKGKVLLFPGDAQVGNWLSWRDHKYQAGDVTLTADDLLRRTILYKVGHHGSHNATVRRDPREVTETSPLGVPFGLELMNDVVAMIPVDYQAAREKKKVWDMPADRLYRRLREKARRRVLRADESITPLNPPEEPDLVPQSTTWQPIPGLKHAHWRRSAENFTIGDNLGPLYYDVAFELED